MRIVIALWALLATSFAQAGETFECRDAKEAKRSPNSPVLLVATVNDDGKTGFIEVSGIRHEASYEVDGINRHWEFDRDEDGDYQYIFEIQPNGEGTFFDFFSSQYFLCTAK